MDVTSYMLGKKSAGGGGGGTTTPANYNLEDYITIDWSQPGQSSGKYYFNCTVNQTGFSAIKDLIDNDKMIYFVVGIDEYDHSVVHFNYTTASKEGYTVFLTSRVIIDADMRSTSYEVGEARWVLYIASNDLSNARLWYESV